MDAGLSSSSKAGCGAAAHLTAEPIGEALRSAFRADNHDSLSPHITQLLLELSTVDEGLDKPVVQRLWPGADAARNATSAATMREPTRALSGYRAGATVIALLILSGLALTIMSIVH